ncbi:MAG: hypothetical protein WA821_24040 [Anaerolineales bacterium]
MRNSFFRVAVIEPAILARMPCGGTDVGSDGSDGFHAKQAKADANVGQNRPMLCRNLFLETPSVPSRAYCLM